MTPLPLDHPRADELVALAKERGAEAQGKLLGLLDELGLPHDTFTDADAGAVLPSNQVLIGDRVCPYEVADGVMEIRGAVPFYDRLVKHAERLGAWRQSPQVSASGNAYQSEHRTSEGQAITEGAFTGLFTMLRGTLWECARFYQCWNKHVAFGTTEAWEVLRYKEGDAFSVHVDTVAGARRPRQLACLVYLNDEFEGGETCFHAPGPELAVKPEAGKVVLFPPFYTHPHEGLPVTSGTKYIVLGWFC